jgi:hypothetical protein
LYDNGTIIYFAAIPVGKFDATSGIIDLGSNDLSFFFYLEFEGKSETNKQTNKQTTKKRCCFSSLVVQTLISLHSLWIQTNMLQLSTVY